LLQALFSACATKCSASDGASVKGVSVIGESPLLSTLES